MFLLHTLQLKIYLDFFKFFTIFLIQILIAAILSKLKIKIKSFVSPLYDNPESYIVFFIKYVDKTQSFNKSENVNSIPSLIVYFLYISSLHCFVCLVSLAIYYL